MNRKYQLHYSEINPQMFSFQGRRKKAAKIMAILADFVNNSSMKRMEELVCLEVGCSAGGMTKFFAKNFKKLIGIDIDARALKRAQKENTLSNIEYQFGDALALPFASNNFDVVICNHVYEHVPDPLKMISEIHQVLKKDGLCYFAAGNKYILIEGHYFLPFLSWLPKPLANFYLKISGRGDSFYETLFSYWQLKKIVKKFQVYDYTLTVLKKPEQFFATHPFQKIIAKTPNFFLKIFLPLMPTFFWVLKKV